MSLEVLTVRSQSVVTPMGAQAKTDDLYRSYMNVPKQMCTDEQHTSVRASVLEMVSQRSQRNNNNDGDYLPTVLHPAWTF